MLNVKTRQKFLKNLGFYKDKIDGIVGPNTIKAYKKLQTKYFPKKYVDGIYGIQTETLLRNAERVRLYCKNFKLEEFKCECGGKYCTGYPVLLSVQLLKNTQKVRTHHGYAMYVTSGLRCNKLNNSLVGSIRGSKHTKGKAIDFYTSKTGSVSNRKKIIDYYIKLLSANYSYCNGYTRTKLKKGTISASYMGTSIHIDVT